MIKTLLWLPVNGCEKLKNLESVDQTTEPHNTQLKTSYYYACVHDCVCICTFFILLRCTYLLTGSLSLFKQSEEVNF